MANQLPFVKQSMMRKMRAGAFRSKTATGPETTRAMVAGQLDTQAATARLEGQQQSQLVHEKELQEDRISQQQREQSQQADQFRKTQEANFREQERTRIEDNRTARQAKHEERRNQTMQIAGTIMKTIAMGT